MSVLLEAHSRHYLNLKFLGRPLLVGVLVGIIVSFYRWLIPRLGSWTMALLGYLRQVASSPEKGLWAFLALPIAILIFLCIGYAVACLCQLEPMISGSGIPQVSGYLQGRFRLSWLRILCLKFLTGLMILGSGLSLGREGPSVQIGASIAQGYCQLTGQPSGRSRFLIAGGAAAGLSAAFNAPISGLLFALEEIHHAFSPLALLTAMGSALAADFVSAFFFGLEPVLHVPRLPFMRVDIYWLLLLFGIFIGLSGVLFNKLILAGKALYERLHLPQRVKLLIPFLATLLLIWWQPELFGSGEAFIGLLSGDPSHQAAMSHLLLLYVLKLFLLLVAFCSGLPGGIFFPLLVLGSLAGQAFGHLAASLGLINPDWIIIFSTIAMSAHFAAIVRSPITGILLIVEMTASLHYLLPIGFVTLIAYFTAECLRSEPIYESLLNLLLKKQKKAEAAVQSTDRRSDQRSDPRSASSDQKSASSDQAPSASAHTSPPRAELPLEKSPQDEQDTFTSPRLPYWQQIWQKFAQVNHWFQAPQLSTHSSLECLIQMGSPAEGKPIAELDLPPHVLIIAVRRGQKELLPSGQLKLEAGDRLYCLFAREQQQALQRQLAKLCQCSFLPGNPTSEAAEEDEQAEL